MLYLFQLEKSREATDTANIRAEYAELMTEVLTEDTIGEHKVTLNQKQDGWQNAEDKTGLKKSMTLSGTPTASGTATLTYDEKTGTVTCTFGQ